MEGISDPHNVALGRAIRDLRRKAGLSQEELAARARVPAAELSSIEAGHVEADWGTLRQIAYGLEVSLPALLRLAEGPPGD